GHSSGRLQPAKSRCRHTANGFPKQIGGTWSTTFGHFQSIKQGANEVKSPDYPLIQLHAQYTKRSWNRKVTKPLLFRSAAPHCSLRFLLQMNTSTLMKTTNNYRKIALLSLAVAMFTAASARADTYSWTNLQSDIAGVAQHVDPNLVNPWGMAVGSTGIIWVSDNGTGVSTLYNQDGTAVPRVVEIPTAKQNRDGGNPTGIVFNNTGFFQVTKNGTSASAIFIFVSEDGSISGWNPT